MDKPSNFEQVAESLTPEVYQNLKTAIEIGRWPNGETLSAQQKQVSLEAVLHYEAKNLPPEERTGYMPNKKSACATDTADEKPLRWQD